MANESVDTTGAPIRTVKIDQSVPGTTNKVDIGTIVLPAVAQGAAGAAPWPTVPSAQEIHLGQVGGHTYTVSASVTRPADTNAYTANDAIANSTSAPVVRTFTNCARVANGSGQVQSAILIDSGNVATGPQIELWLFDTAPVAQADNAAFTPSDAELLTLVGVIPFNLKYVGDETANAGGNAVYVGTVPGYPFVCTGGSRDLYGKLKVKNAYVPLSAEVFTVRLGILGD